MAESQDEQKSKKRAWALGDECEFLSSTHAQWFKCRIVECRGADGAVQINLKPGEWLPDDVQEQRLRTRVDGLRHKVLADLQAAMTSSTLFGHLADEARDRATSVLDGRTAGDSFRLWWRDALVTTGGEVATQEAGDAILDLKSCGPDITTAVQAVLAFGPASGAAAEAAGPSLEGRGIAVEMGAAQQRTTALTTVLTATGVQKELLRFLTGEEAQRTLITADWSDPVLQEEYADNLCLYHRWLDRVADALETAAEEFDYHASRQDLTDDSFIILQAQCLSESFESYGLGIPAWARNILSAAEEPTDDYEGEDVYRAL